MIVKDISPLMFIGNIVRVYVWSLFKWNVYLIFEQKPKKLNPGPMRDLEEKWLKEFEKMKRR